MGASPANPAWFYILILNLCYIDFEFAFPNRISHLQETIGRYEEDIKNDALQVALACMLCIPAKGQIRDISLLAGVNLPIYSEVQGGGMYEANYGQFSSSGFGFRGGVQWIPEVAGVENGVGIPLAFAYRTRTRSTQQRLSSALVGAMDGADRLYGSSDDRAGGVLGGLLMNLFSDMEFFAGITPRYTTGPSGSVSHATWGDSWQYWKDQWTGKKRNASMTIDAGMRVNYSIWRFDIAIVPALHYDPTSQLVSYSQIGEDGVGVTSSSEQPLNWYFTLSAGFAYRF